MMDTQRLGVPKGKHGNYSLGGSQLQKAEAPVVRSIRPRLKVGFYDFWPNLQPADNYFYHVLSLRCDVVLDQVNPDVAIFSVFGEEHRKVNCKKYLFTGETRKAPPDTFNCSFTFDASHGANYRLPLWVLYINWFGTPYSDKNSPSYLVPPEVLTGKRPCEERQLFCNFIYNNDAGERVRFLDILAKYNKVDCLGALRNNTWHLGGDELTKVNAQRQYRFTIAFENANYPGYVTEKILHAFAAQSVPIYWGCPEVALDFNPDAFLDARNYASLEALADAVLEIDSDPCRRERMATAPVFRHGIPSQFLPEAVADFFEGTI